MSDSTIHALVIHAAYEEFISFADATGPKKKSQKTSVRWLTELYDLKEIWKDREENRTLAEFSIDVKCPFDLKNAPKNILPICSVFGSSSISVRMGYVDENLTSELFCEVKSPVPLNGGSAMKNLARLVKEGSLGVPIEVAGAFEMCIDPVRPFKK